MTQKESNKAQTPAQRKAAQRKAAQRARKKAMGLVRVKIPELWHKPEAAKKLELDIARLVQRSISEARMDEHHDNDNPKQNNS